MISSLHGRVSACISEYSNKLLHRQWFLDMFPGPWRDVNHRIVSVFNAVVSEGLMITHIPRVFSPVPCLQKSFNDVYYRQSPSSSFGFT